MKEPFDIFTVFEIKQSLKSASNFFGRFEEPNTVPIYTLAELGELHQISPALLATILLKFEHVAKEEFTDETDDFDHFSISHILKYVEITHQFYTTERIKRIEQIIINIEKQVAGNNPLTDLLYQSYVDFRQFLFQHLQHEEEILFPYIECLLEYSSEASENQPRYLKSKLPECFLHSHTEETDFNLFKIFTLVPAQFYEMETTEDLMLLEAELKSFQVDLNVHSWIEEQVLIPKVIALRKELFNQ